jgi:hypothetical protein
VEKELARRRAGLLHPYAGPGDIDFHAQLVRIIDFSKDEINNERRREQVTNPDAKQGGTEQAVPHRPARLAVSFIRYHGFFGLQVSELPWFF